MKKISFLATCVVTSWVACVDYSDPKTGSGEAGAPLVQSEPDAGTSTCGSRSYRGGSAGVVCPGVAKCECGQDDVCCMQRVDSQSGSCTSLAACRGLALQCDGPEDCGDGGVCCLEDRTGGGSSCKTSCTGGQWLCRTDSDCANSPSGTRCAPLDLGTPGVDDVGLDGIVGVCGK